MPDALLAPNATIHTQIFWSSIGYTVGGALGACVAARELSLPGRVILIVGDGSLQMTVQEIGSYIRFGFSPIIFVINNDGYAIERAIHGPEQGYNDINTNWEYQKMLEFFGSRAKGFKSRSYKCETIEELEKVLNDDEFQKAECVQVFPPPPPSIPSSLTAPERPRSTLR
jgi:pyruvate decarboxylase